ncbi:neuronal-specific septin-3-like isoform X2 [Sycon ciliatum]|uniref:neuronal-specific septin-3-like isoform X2 n=1 Tax=Sycon ciliatum TaxID=27933 RepID=UPI0020AA760E|eukprot:scpid25788/ scgid0796/ Septin-12
MSSSVPSNGSVLIAPSNFYNVQQLTTRQKEAFVRAFQEADTNDAGLVAVSAIPNLVQQVLGSVSNHEMQEVQSRVDIRAHKGEVTFPDFMEIMTETMSSTTQWGQLKTPLSGTVGFDSLQTQITQKALKRGFEFNLMVVGESGMGKSTLVNTLFKAKVSRPSCMQVTTPIPSTVDINAVSHVIEEKGVRLKLTITDTPGFGDQINNKDCWTPIVDYVNEQFELYLAEEVSINRKRFIPDSRIHCCLYFIQPSGHALKPLDIEFMRHLHDCVNIVPVIAKADTLTVEERDSFKHRIREDIKTHNIRIYPQGYDPEDEAEKALADAIDALIPFGVVGSDRAIKVGNKDVYGRQTRWGVIEVENRDHCEFSQLRDMLIKTHMQDLKEKTDKVHYENFRRQRLQQHHEQASKYTGESNI